MIPQVIHQTGPDNWKENAVWNEYQPTWQQMHPGWQYYFWTDAQNEAFVAAKFPEYLDLYQALPYTINRVDMVRYLYLYEFGGFYVDLDCKCYKSFEALRSKASIVLGQQTFIGSTHVECAVIGSVQKHPFWLTVIAEIKRSLEAFSSHPIKSLRILNTTGPFMLSRCVNQYSDEKDAKSQFFVAPKDWFFASQEADISASSSSSSSSSTPFAYHYSVRSWIDNGLERRMSDLHAWRKPIGPLIIAVIFIVIISLLIFLVWKGISFLVRKK